MKEISGDQRRIDIVTEVSPVVGSTPQPGGGIVTDVSQDSKSSGGDVPNPS